MLVTNYSNQYKIIRPFLRNSNNTTYVYPFELYKKCNNAYSLLWPDIAVRKASFITVSMKSWTYVPKLKKYFGLRYNTGAIYESDDFLIWTVATKFSTLTFPLNCIGSIHYDDINDIIYIQQYCTNPYYVDPIRGYFCYYTNIDTDRPILHNERVGTQSTNVASLFFLRHINRYVWYNNDRFGGSTYHRYFVDYTDNVKSGWDEHVFSAGYGKFDNYVGTGFQIYCEELKRLYSFVDASTVFYTADGINWDTATKVIDNTNNTTVLFDNIIRGYNNVTHAVTYIANEGTHYYVSTNCLHWTTITLTGTIQNGVFYNSHLNCFMYIANEYPNRIYYSINGIIWKYKTVFTLDKWKNNDSSKSNYMNTILTSIALHKNLLSVSRECTQGTDKTTGDYLFKINKW